MVTTPTVPASCLTVEEIADLLGEAEPRPCAQIAQLMTRLGPIAMTVLVEAVLSIEVQGGMLTAAGRRRTPGGILLYLTQGRVWHPAVTRPAPPAPPLPLAEALAQIPDDLMKGVANVKVVLTGRPKETLDRGEYVVLHLDSPGPKNVPRGLPIPPTDGLTWTVLIARKLWHNVATALRQDKEDILVLEGQPCQQAGVLVLYATQVTTKNLQRARKEQQQAQAKAEVPA